MIEGILIGLAGSVLPLAIIYVIYNNVIAYVSTRFSMLSQLLKFLTVDQVFQVLMPISLIIGIGIGFFGSFQQYESISGYDAGLIQDRKGKVFRNGKEKGVIGAIMAAVLLIGATGTAFAAPESADSLDDAINKGTDALSDAQDEKKQLQSNLSAAQAMKRNWKCQDRTDR